MEMFVFSQRVCKLQKNCPFFHPANLCPQFQEEGICLKTICRDRHQKLCRYLQKGNCSRFESCQFSHRRSKKDFNVTKHKQCDKCESETDHTDYCKFCGTNFRSKCTI